MSIDALFKTLSVTCSSVKIVSFYSSGTQHSCNIAAASRFQFSCSTSKAGHTCHEASHFQLPGLAIEMALDLDPVGYFLDSSYDETNYRVKICFEVQSWTCIWMSFGFDLVAAIDLNLNLNLNLVLKPNLKSGSEILILILVNTFESAN